MLDTKLKTFKISKITIIVFSLIFIISISTILSYKNIRKNTLKNNLSILYDDSILNDIRIGNQELYRDIRKMIQKLIRLIIKILFMKILWTIG